MTDTGELRDSLDEARDRINKERMAHLETIIKGIGDVMNKAITDLSKKVSQNHQETKTALDDLTVRVGSIEKKDAIQERVEEVTREILETDAPVKVRGRYRLSSTHKTAGGFAVILAIIEAVRHFAG